MKNTIKSILGFLTCYMLGSHDWTSAAQEGVKPTKEQLKSIAGFYEYSNMYCKKCGKESNLNFK